MATPSTTLPNAPVRVTVSDDLSPSDAVWVATALLHHRQPERESFLPEEIVSAVAHHQLSRASRRSIARQVDEGCVANREPRSEALADRASILFALPDGNRRLYRTLDLADRARWGSLRHIAWEALPEEFAYLRSWYEQWNQKSIDASPDPLLRLYGSGKDIWADEHSDEYVANLREGWENRL